MFGWHTLPLSSERMISTTRWGDTIFHGQDGVVPSAILTINIWASFHVTSINSMEKYFISFMQAFKGKKVSPRGAIAVAGPPLGSQVDDITRELAISRESSEAIPTVLLHLCVQYNVGCHGSRSLLQLLLYYFSSFIQTACSLSMLLHFTSISLQKQENILSVG